MNRMNYCLIAIVFSLFLSCKKDEIYKDPEEIVINGNSYQLHDSTVIIYNSHLKSMGAEEDEITWDETTGIMTISKNMAQQAGYVFLENGVFICDLDTTGILRRISSLDSTSLLYIISTEQANLEDVFSGLDVELSTDEAEMMLTGSEKQEDIGKALTDRHGVLHPFKIVDYDEQGNVLNLWSAYEPAPGNLGADFNFDVKYSYSDVQLYEYKKDHFTATVSALNGFINLKNTTTISISVKTDWSHVIPHTYLNTFYCANKSTFHLNTQLQLQANTEFTHQSDKPVHMKKLFSKKYCYMVGVVPVWITVKADLYRHIEASATGNAKLTWGLGYDINSCKFGVKYKHGSGWSPVTEFSHTFTTKSVKMEGDVNASARAEIYPRMEVALYGVAGPWVEMVPFLQTTNNYHFDYLVGGEKNTYWNILFSTGIDTRLGAKVKVLGYTLAEYHKTFNTLKPVTIYHAPDKIQISDGDNQTGTKGHTLGKKLEVKVLDSWNKVIPLAPVYFEPVTIEDGTAGARLSLTDSIGITSTSWTLGKLNSHQNMKVSLKKDKSTLINSVTFKATAN